MALRTLAGRWRAGAGIAAAIAAGGTVAYCEDPKSGVGFDPEALERGAKALREINKSPYAKKVRDAPDLCGSQWALPPLAAPVFEILTKADLQTRSRGDSLRDTQVFELAREQERTKQAEASKEQAQYTVYAEQQRRVCAYNLDSIDV